MSANTSKPLLSISLLPPNHNAARLNNDFITFVEKRLIQNLPPEDSKCQYVSRRLIQSISLVVSIAGKVPFIPINLKFAGSNRIWGIILSYGNGASFTALISWAMLEVIDGYLGPKGKEELNLLRPQIGQCTRTALSVCSVSFGAISQLAISYLAYTYNDQKLYMALLIMASDSWVPIHSLQLSFNRIAEKGCRLSSFNKELAAIKARMISAIDHNRTSLADPQFRKSYLETFSKLIEAENSDQKSLDIIALLTKRPLKQIQKPSCTMRAMQNLIKLIGCSFTASQMMIQGWVGYQGAMLFSNNPYVGVATATLIVGSNIYLSGASIPRTALRLFNTTTELVCCRYKKSISTQLRPKLSLALKTIGLATVALSWAPSVQISRDYFEGNLSLYMQITVSSATILFTMTAILDIIDDLIENHIHRCGSEEEKQLLDLDLKMKKFAKLIDKSPFLQFAKLAHLLPEGVLARFVDDVKGTQERLASYFNED